MLASDLEAITDGAVHVTDGVDIMDGDTLVMATAGVGDIPAGVGDIPDGVITHLIIHLIILLIILDITKEQPTEKDMHIIPAD